MAVSFHLFSARHRVEDGASQDGRARKNTAGVTEAAASPETVRRHRTPGIRKGPRPTRRRPEKSLTLRCLAFGVLKGSVAVGAGRMLRYLLGQIASLRPAFLHIVGVEAQGFQ